MPFNHLSRVLGILSALLIKKKHRQEYLIVKRQCPYDDGLLTKQNNILFFFLIRYGETSYFNLYFIWHINREKST